LPAHFRRQHNDDLKIESLFLRFFWIKFHKKIKLCSSRVCWISLKSSPGPLAKLGYYYFGV
jgi:hypothetical protein